MSVIPQSFGVSHVSSWIAPSIPDPDETRAVPEASSVRDMGILSPLGRDSCVGEKSALLNSVLFTCQILSTGQIKVVRKTNRYLDAIRTFCAHPVDGHKKTALGRRLETQSVTGFSMSRGDRI